MTEDARQEIERLFQHYGAGVGRYVLLRVRSPELAEEITARVFLTVVRQYHQKSASGVGWLWSIVRTELSRHFRQTSLASYPTEMESTEPLPLDQLEREEIIELLRDCLIRLGDEERELIALKFVAGLSNVDIAHALALTPSNVGVKIHRALKTLRSMMARPLALDP